MNTIVQLVSRTFRKLNEVQWVALLLSRIAIGFFFVMSGYNKFFVQGIGYLRDEFIEYGIPLPLMNAWLDALVQFIGGVALIFGLGTRIWSVMIGFAMIVASFTVTIPEVIQKDIAGAESSLLFWGWFYYRPEPVYITVLLLLIFVGPGKVSLDNLIARKLGVDRD
jgi:putative oxidoreductase